MELKQYFGIDEVLSPATARDIWDRVNAMLTTDAYRVQGLIQMSKVETICTTDDPYDTLDYHRQLKNFAVKVVPAFRPDSGILRVISRNGWISSIRMVVVFLTMRWTR